MCLESAWIVLLYSLSDLNVFVCICWNKIKSISFYFFFSKAIFKLVQIWCKINNQKNKKEKDERTTPFIFRVMIISFPGLYMFQTPNDKNMDVTMLYISNIICECMQKLLVNKTNCPRLRFAIKVLRALLRLLDL